MEYHQLSKSDPSDCDETNASSDEETKIQSLANTATITKVNCVHFYQMFKDIQLASYTHDFNGIFYVCECVAGYMHFYTGELYTLQQINSDLYNL